MLCTLPSSRGTLFSARKATPQRSSAVIKTRLPRMVVRASQGQPDEKTLAEKLALPAAAFLGAALLFAATPDDALAARSGGRVGGSSGFASRRAAPAPAPRGPVVNNYYSAPPVFGGGFGMPFFPGFGVGYGFGFGMPIFGLSSLFNLMLLSIVISVVWSVISNLTNRPRDNTKSDDEW